MCNDALRITLEHCHEVTTRRKSSVFTIRVSLTNSIFSVILLTASTKRLLHIISWQWLDADRIKLQINSKISPAFFSFLLILFTNRTYPRQCIILILSHLRLSMDFLPFCGDTTTPNVKRVQKTNGDSYFVECHNNS